MKWMQGVFSALMVAAAVVIVGCSNSGSSDSPAPSTVDNLGQSLIGKWGRGCTSTVSGTATTNDIGSYLFDGTHFTVEATTFEDAQCAKASMTVSFVGTYSAGTAGGSASLAGATDFDFNGTQASFTPRGASTAGFLNGVAYCGFTDWAVDATKVITSNNACFATFHAQGLQIYQIKNGALYVGTATSAPNTRPTTLDPHPFQPL